MEPRAKPGSKIVCYVPKEDDDNTDEMIKLSIKEEDKGNTFRISSIGISVACFKKRLLVLDINGLLADIVSSPPKHIKADATVARKACEKLLCYLYCLYCFNEFSLLY